MFLLILLIALPALTAQQCFTDDGDLPRDPKLVQELLYKGEPQFSHEIFKEIVSSTSPEKNIIFSPFSIYNALLLSYLIAGGKTEESIKEALHIPMSTMKNQVAHAFKSYPKMTSEHYELSSPSKLFTASQLRVRECTKNFFVNEITELDFLKGHTGAIAYMNRWVANETKNMIRKVFKDGMVDRSAKLVLANVASFQGTWHRDFDPSLTSNKTFYGSASKKIVPMMHKTGIFDIAFSLELQSRMLSMPYRGNEVSMYVVLPSDSRGLSRVLDRFNLNMFNTLRKAVSSEIVELSFPKFDIEKEIEDFTEILQKMGIGDLFQSTANLTGLSDDSIFFNRAIHQTRIKVDERGTEAASEASFVPRTSSLDPWNVNIFTCDHPFLYLIHDKTSDNILFMGVYRDAAPFRAN